MTHGHSMDAMAPMTTAVMYWGDRVRVGEYEDEPRDGCADALPMMCWSIRTLLPDHLAEWAYGPAVGGSERRVTIPGVNLTNA